MSKPKNTKTMVRVSLPPELGTGYVTIQCEQTDTMRSIADAVVTKAGRRGPPTSVKWDYRLKLPDSEDDEYLTHTFTIREIAGVKARKLELILERADVDDDDVPPPPPEDHPIAIEQNVDPPAEPLPPRMSVLSRPPPEKVAKEPEKPPRKEDHTIVQTIEGLTCVRCHKEIDGTHFTLDNDTYHKNCFSCSVCGKNMAGTPVSHRDGKIFCEKDYLDAYGDHCGSCGEVIRDRVLLACDAKWHVHCFKCCRCMTPLEGSPFFVEDCNVYCEKDYKELFAPHCKRCNKVIEGQCVHVASLDAKFHPKCLACAVCKVELCGKKFYCDDNDDEIYCGVHYEQHATRCAKCGMFITSSVLHANEKHYHEACYQSMMEPAPPSPPTSPPVSPATAPAASAPVDDELPPAFTKAASLGSPNNAGSPPASPRPSALPVKDMPDKNKEKVKGKENLAVKSKDLKRGSWMFGLGGKADAKHRAKLGDKEGAPPGDGELTFHSKSVGSASSPRLHGQSHDGTENGRSEASVSNSVSKSKREISNASNRDLSDEEADSSDDEKSMKGSHKKKPAGYVKYKDMVDGSTLAPYIKHGIGYCLKSQDYHLFRPDYRKKDLYQLTFTNVNFSFQDYAPRVFYSIRAMYGIDQESYLNSLVVQGIGGGKLGAGKSGMLFYYSNDRKFVLKSTTRGELKFFRKILRDYYTHMTHNPHSLLPRFFGLYKITMPDQKPLRLIIMNNIFQTSLTIHEKFDLKGSTRNRYVDVEKEKESSGGVLKDLNYQDKMYVGAEGRKALKTQMERDTEFLIEMNIMDQSLLLGVHRHTPGDPPIGQEMALTMRTLSGPLLPGNPAVPGKDYHSCFQQAHGGIRGYSPGKNSAPNGDVYFMAIIDILQMFDMKKRVESTYKGMLYNKKAISAVSSRRYAERFLEYMDAHIE